MYAGDTIIRLTQRIRLDIQIAVFVANIQLRPAQDGYALDFAVEYAHILKMHHIGRVAQGRRMVGDGQAFQPRARGGGSVLQDR